MPNPKYQAFVDVAGIGRPNHEYLDFLKQMRRLYASSENGGDMLITNSDHFTSFVQVHAMLYAAAAHLDVPLARISGSLVERIAAAPCKAPGESDTEFKARIVEDLP